MFSREKKGLPKRTWSIVAQLRELRKDIRKSARRRRLLPKGHAGELTEEQQKMVLAAWKKYGPFASHKIACELALTHSIVHAHVKRLNEVLG